MKTQTLLSTCITGFFITTSSLAQGFCIVENGGCRDNASGKLYIQEGNRLVDPESKHVYMEIPPVPVTGPVIIRPRSEPQSGIPINPSTGRPYPVVTRNIEPADEPANGQPYPGVSGRVIPNGQFQPHPRTSFDPGPAGSITNQNGQFHRY